MTRISIILGGLFLLVGCQRPQTQYASLKEPVAVRSLGLLDCQIDLTATGGANSTPTPLQLRAQGVDLELKTGDKPQLMAMTLPVGDVDVSPQLMPPNGIKLRQISLSVAQPVAAHVVRATDNAVEITVHTPLTLHWRMVLDDGTTWALGPTRTEALDLDVRVVRAGDVYSAVVDASCPGECFVLDGVTALRNGQLDLAADVDVTPAL